jgi:hypothetical protein
VHRQEGVRYARRMRGKNGIGPIRNVSYEAWRGGRV